jgi:hypothetical protein
MASLPRRLIRSRHLFGNNNVFLKLESEDFHIIPENKARKLEFVIGDSLRKKKKKLVTFGYVGSPHCYSTVKAASELGDSAMTSMLRLPPPVGCILGVLHRLYKPQAPHCGKEDLVLGPPVNVEPPKKGIMRPPPWLYVCEPLR